MFNLSSDVIAEGQFILFQDMRSTSYQYSDTPTQRSYRVNLILTREQINLFYLFDVY